MVCKEDCSHSVPHDRRDGCGKCLDFCAGCIPVESPEEPEKDDDCTCDKEPVVWVVVAGHGELNWGCPDCRKIYGNWKPIHLRKEKDCWLCGGTGSIMMDRQTGAMFAKEPSIDWSEKDCYEHQCPNCGIGTEGK